MRAVLFFAALLTAALTLPAYADEPEYLRGYLNALLDTRFPGYGLRVRELYPDGRVVLYSDTCIGPWQRRKVAESIQDTGRVTEVAWDKRVDCSPEPSKATKTERVIEIHSLPEAPMFAPMLADPRQPRFSTSYQRYHIPTRAFNAASVAFGEYFGFASGFDGSNGSAQTGVQGAVFALFDLDSASNDLVNADYWIGLPLTYRRGRLSYMARVYHQSSHLGDEFLLDNPQVARVNLSYEDLEFLASYEWERARIYGGGGYLLHSEPSLAPAHARIGGEYILPRALLGLNVIAASDLQASQELGWQVSQSYQLGLELRNGERRVRLMLEHFVGHSPNGQFFREHVRYSGIGLYFGF